MADTLIPLDNAPEIVYAEGMVKIIAIEGKRPADATREAGLKLREAGLTYRQIGQLWGVSGARVFQILNPKSLA